MTIDTFKAKYPLRREWLELIVEFLLSQARGTASVDKMALALTDLRAGNKAPKETITRAINTYCAQAADYDPAKPSYFTKVEPGVYRLDTFPDAPAELTARTDLAFVEFAVEQAYVGLRRLLKAAKALDRWDRLKRDEKVAALAGDTKVAALFEAEVERSRKFHLAIDDLEL